MVSPAKPNSTGQTTAKTPKEPKVAPSEESLIPPELARQNIPTPDSMKKLEENTFTPKDDLTPQDVTVTKKAQEVLGIEDTSETDSDGLDFFDSLMEEETPPSEAVHQPVDSPTETPEDGVDFFDDLIGSDSNTTENSPSAPAEQKLNTAKGALENLIGQIGTEIKQDAETTLIPISLIMDRVFEKFSDKDFKLITEKTPIKLTHIHFRNISHYETLKEIDNQSYFYNSKTNILFSKFEKNDKSIKQIHQFIQSLNLSPQKVASLRIVQLNEQQWHIVTTQITQLIKQSQEKANQATTSSENEDQTSTVNQKFTDQPQSRPIPFGSKKPTKFLDKSLKREMDLESEFIQEEILTKERSKLRDKRAAEKEHKAIDKEIQNWERKHSELKREADARDIKRRTP